jgi:glutamate-1-semialdehyde 2,1-aminomutase
VHYGITPDLATFGKVIGGGMPVGAFGGARMLMRELAPEGAVYQAGTLSGNPVAMTAGLTTLRILQQEDGWSRLERLGAYLEQRVAAVLDASGVAATLSRLGSIFWIAWHMDSAPRAAEQIDPRGSALYANVFHALLERGISLAPSAFEVGFLSLAHEPAHIDRLADALAAALGAAAAPDRGGRP